MEQTGHHTYQENDVTVVFSLTPDSNSNKEPLYKFEIEDDPEFTKKLQLCIKEDGVTQRGIRECAMELFRIIRRRDYTPLPSALEKHKLHEEFIKLYGRLPKFTVVRSVRGAKENTVVLEEAGYRVEGIARHEQVAKAFALRKHFACIATEPLQLYGS
jgi:hypothetical protein